MEPTTIFVDSSQKSSSSETSSKFTITLPENLKGRQFKKVSLENIAIPISYYNVSDDLGTNKFMINDGTDDVEITLTDGIYDTTTELATEIETQLNTLYSAEFTVSYSTYTAKYTIERTSNFSLLLADYANFAMMTGFLADDITYVDSDSYTSANIGKLRIISNFFLIIDEIHTEVIHPFPEISSVVAIIPNQGNLGVVQYTSPSDKVMYSLRESSIYNKLHVNLKISEGALNLNGQDISFMIRLWD